MTERIEVVPLRCGVIEAPARLMEEGATGTLAFPVWAFLVNHPSRGRVVFDAGMHPGDDGRTVSDFYRFQVPAEATVAARLRSHGVEPEAIDRVVLSHIHSDHGGGMSLLPNARIFVNRQEEMFARAAGGSYRYVDHGHEKVLIDGDHDLFGDGSVTILATPGHTCGHQSLRIRRFDRADILAGDACYFCRSLARDDADQPSADDKDLYLVTKRRLMAMQAQGDFIVPGHDDAFLRIIPRESCIIAPS